MRYEIVNGQVKESIFIDAPYDTRQDAKEDIANGIEHNCQYCLDETYCIKLGDK